ICATGMEWVWTRRTDGNPLFLVSALDDLVKQGVLLRVDEGWVLQGEMEHLMTEVPESIRHLVARQRERLQSAEQQVLEAASVAGVEVLVGGGGGGLGKGSIPPRGQRRGGWGGRQVLPAGGGARGGPRPGGGRRRPSGPP